MTVLTEEIARTLDSGPALNLICHEWLGKSTDEHWVLREEGSKACHFMADAGITEENRETVVAQLEAWKGSIPHAADWSRFSIKPWSPVQKWSSSSKRSLRLLEAMWATVGPVDLDDSKRWYATAHVATQGITLGAFAPNPQLAIARLCAVLKARDITRFDLKPNGVR